MENSLRRLDMRWPDIRYCTRAIRIAHDLMVHPDDLDMRKTASNWAETNPPEIGPGTVIPGIGPAFFDEADHAVFVAWIKVQIILGNARDALNVIQPMLEAAQEHQLIHRVIELSLLEAQAFFIQGLRERAWGPLWLALSHAETNGYLCSVDQDPVLIRLLKEAMRSGIAGDFIRRIMEVNGLGTGQTPATMGVYPAAGEDGLIEPLSNREKEVLGLMADGLSNSEIATRLFLSPNTLKAHTQNIFGKLNVHNRMQAVNRARDLKLL